MSDGLSEFEIIWSDAAVYNDSGKRWRIVSQAWDMQPEGQISCPEAEALCNFIVKAVENHDALVGALRNARNYIDAVIVNTPDKKKRRNYSDCLRIIEAALKPVGGNSFQDAIIPDVVEDVGK